MGADRTRFILIITGEAVAEKQSIFDAAKAAVETAIGSDFVQTAELKLHVGEGYSPDNVDVIKAINDPVYAFQNKVGPEPEKPVVEPEQTPTGSEQKKTAKAK